ncbi:hypothetical protein D9M71_380180 [compost metagenome]
MLLTNCQRNTAHKVGTPMIPGHAMLAQNTLHGGACAASSRPAAASHQMMPMCRTMKLSRPGKCRWRLTQRAMNTTPRATSRVRSTAAFRLQPPARQAFTVALRKGRGNRRDVSGKAAEGWALAVLT